MAETLNILRTKLHPPKTFNDHVYRVRLIEKLNNNYKKNALTLVSAPAGYGKSYLVSCWLNESNIPFGWISLSEDDNDLRTFLEYLVAAVEKVSPEKLEKTSDLLKAAELPPLSVITNLLSNELDEIDKEFVLVLDDYHLIKEKEIHDLIDGLLQYPPDNMVLCIITRRDPPLKIGSLRAYNRMNEIRMEELSFTVQEIPVLYKNMIGLGINEKISEKLLKRTEGWVTGLRLTAHSIKTIEQLESMLKRMKGDSRFITEYLVEQALSWQPEEYQNYLMKTSLLDRYCADVLDALDITESTEKEKRISGVEFIEWLEKTNLFVIPLDDEHKWFRYHHEFKRLLQKQLKKKRSPEQIKTIYKKASEWFEKNNLIDEAIKLTLMSGDSNGAADIIKRNRLARMEDDQWYVISNWLNLIPAETLQQRPNLLLSKAWIFYEQSNIIDLIAIIESLEQHLKDNNLDEELVGELNFFKGYFSYFQGEGGKSRKYLEKALAKVGNRYGYIQGEIEIMLGIARQMCGEEELAINSLNKKLSEVDISDKIFITRLYGGLAFIYLLSGKLIQAKETVKLMRINALKINTAHTLSWVSYMEGWVDFHLQNFNQALNEFKHVVDNKFIGAYQVSTDAYAGLVLTYQALKQPVEANRAANQMMEFVEAINDPECLSVALSCKAHLSLLQGDNSSAIKWAAKNKETADFASLFFWLESPPITKSRILVAEGSGKNLESAIELLNELHQIADSGKFTCHKMNILVLQSLAFEKQGQSTEALDKLQEAVSLAELRKCIYPFLDSESLLAELLTKLKEKNYKVDFIDKILNALKKNKEASAYNKIQTTSVSSGNLSVIESLTERELEILTLLSRGLKNREIGDKIFLAQTTIKKHIYNIYQKLDVHSRIEVVTKAKELNIIS